ncbi:MAG: response regulator transcription factor [Actinobacteria bacterium]|nr:response regulator transcription factor [Cyanobacteriota bacterium]MCL5772490.1 response regulator transcription factor [Actinomycetota bacterium]
MKILIIEDEKLIADILKKGLEYHRFSVDVAYDGKIGYDLTQQYEYDVIILDLMLPDIPGEEVCKRIRQDRNNAYILMLTAKKQDEDIVNGLNYGADDYLTKPFEFSVLLARIRALLRRNSQRKENILEAFDIKLFIDQEKVMAGSKEIELTKKEYMILEYLLRNKGQLLSRNQILEHAWDRNVDIFTNIVNTHIKNLRKKLGKSGNIIETVYGSGYRIKEKN